MWYMDNCIEQNDSTDVIVRQQYMQTQVTYLPFPMKFYHFELFPNTVSTAIIWTKMQSSYFIYEFLHIFIF